MHSQAVYMLQGCCMHQCIMCTPHVCICILYHTTCCCCLHSCQLSTYSMYAFIASSEPIPVKQQCRLWHHKRFQQRLKFRCIGAHGVQSRKLACNCKHAADRASSAKTAGRQPALLHRPLDCVLPFLLFQESHFFLPLRSRSPGLAAGR
jgi:hypothetical protein